jgi:hypothetical protein
VADGRQRDLRHPHQRRSLSDAVGPGDRFDGRLHDRATFRVEPSIHSPLRFARPGMRKVLLRALVLLVGVLDRAQAANQSLELSDGSVHGRLDQVLDELVLAVVREPGDRPHLGIGQPPRTHGGSKLREASQRPGHPNMLDRGAMRQTAVVPEPAGRGRQPEHRTALAGVELRDQKQPTTRGGGQAAGQGHDLRPEFVDGEWCFSWPSEVDNPQPRRSGKYCLRSGICPRHAMKVAEPSDRKPGEVDQVAAALVMEQAAHRPSSSTV